MTLDPKTIAALNGVADAAVRDEVPREIRCELGIQGGRVVFQWGSDAVGMTADEADEMAGQLAIAAEDARGGTVSASVGDIVLRIPAVMAAEIAKDMRTFAVELRNGGRLS